MYSCGGGGGGRGKWGGVPKKFKGSFDTGPLSLSIGRGGGCKSGKQFRNFHFL